MLVVNSLLDTDLYKFTMHQIVFHRFPGAYAKYRFKCRNKVDLVPFKKMIEAEFDHLCSLRMSSKECGYLRSLPFLTEDYVDFIEDFSPKRRYIHVDITNGELDIWFEGPLLQTMPLEIYALKIVNEVYFRNTVKTPDFKEGMNRLKTKIKSIKEYADKPETYFHLIDFGTRRAFSGPWQKEVVGELHKHLGDEYLKGTSNVKLAMDLGLTPVGSMAHEFVQMFQGLSVGDIKESQKVAFQYWGEEYRGHLGIALSDTLGMGMFLRDFEYYFAKLYAGTRHDSGDPFLFADQMVEHYNKLGIDPLTKIIIFSDGLDIPLAIRLAEHCRGRIQVSFGIGTNLTNDLGYEPLQIVIKMVECGLKKDVLRPVAKISNNPSKSMCEDKAYADYLMKIIAKYNNL